MNNKGFSLVEVIIVIAIIAILSAIAIPAYSNYVLRTRFQDEIDKMDNYRKAIAIFIQEERITSDEAFQSGVANVKDNYLGDENVAIISELKQNNGRLISHPIINGDTFQIAITPRISENGNLIEWECNIRNQTTNSAPPTSAMPNNCTSTNQDFNDDQTAYNEAFDNLVNQRSNVYSDASNEWNNRYNAALASDEKYNNFIDARDSALQDYSQYNTQVHNLDSQITSKQSELNSLENGTTAYTNLQNEISSLESQKNTAQANSTNAWNDYIANNDNANTRANEVRQTTQNTTIPDNITIPEGSTMAEELAKYSYSAATEQAENDYSTSINNLNNSDAYGENHVERKNSDGTMYSG